MTSRKHVPSSPQNPSQRAYFEQHPDQTKQEPSKKTRFSNEICTFLFFLKNLISIRKTKPQEGKKEEERCFNYIKYNISKKGIPRILQYLSEKADFEHDPDFKNSIHDEKQILNATKIIKTQSMK